MSEMLLLYQSPPEPWVKDAYDELMACERAALTQAGEVVPTPDGARFCNDVVGPYLEERKLMPSNVSCGYGEWASMVAPILVGKGIVTDLSIDALGILLIIVTRHGTSQRDRNDFARTLGRRKMRA